MTKYLLRPAATAYIRAKGLQIAEHGLRDLAARSRGPRHAIVNGRAVTTAEWLDAWIDEQASRPPRRRRQPSDATVSL